MSVTITISGLPASAAHTFDLPGIARALRPFLTPALNVAAEAAGLGVFAPAIVSVVVRAAQISPPKLAGLPAVA
jgi:hypothetical protein